MPRNHNSLTTFHIKTLIIITLSISSFVLNAQNIRAMWVTAWNLTSEKSIDSVFAVAKRHHFNQVFVQTRYRGDALYTPNKNDSTYTNPEKRSYILKNSAFDPLEYCIQKGKNDSIEVHAWVTVFVVSPRDLKKLSEDHMFYQHKDWITRDAKGKAMSHTQLEGAYVDPAVSMMRTYTINLLSDIAVNYEIDGLQLDYIRYPDSIYGYHPESLEKFETYGNGNFNDWKRRQVSAFVNLTYIQLKNIRPDLQISAAVKADYQAAYNRYGQEWKSWLSERFIDKVYLMAYSRSTESLRKQIEGNMDVKHREKMVVGLRAWTENKPYPAFKINEKIALLQQLGFPHLGFYSYSGMLSQNYFKHIEFNERAEGSSQK